MVNKRILNQRWESAVKEAKRVNKRFKKGHIVSFEGRRIWKRLTITKNGIYEPFGDGCKIIWFEKNNSCIGLYDSVDIVRSNFRGIHFEKESNLIDEDVDC
jgi:hypothetical protein